MAAVRSTLLAVRTTGCLLAGLIAAGPAFAAPPARKAARPAEPACTAAAAPDTRYVASSTARMRARPSTDAATVATLPIATAVQVDCVAGPWVRGRSEGERATHGWVHTDLLQAQRPELDALIAAHAKARPAERRAMAERAVALAPFDARSHQLLIDTLNARRDRKGAQQAMATRDRAISPQGEQLPREPWTLFAVEDGMANAVAIVEIPTVPDAGAGVATFRDASSWAPPGAKRDTSPYLSPWRGLHFYRRGGADGVVQVLETPTAEAIGLEAPVRHPPATARDPGLDGLASNRTVTQAAAPPAAAPSRAERSVMDRALRAALNRERVPKRAISDLFAAGADNGNGGVQRHVLAASGKPILLVTANWRLPAASPEAEPSLLDAVVVLEADGRGKYRVSHRLVQTTAGDAIAHHDFIDQLDLEQDGVPELFFRVGHYEGHEYEIWRCDDKTWKVVFAGAYAGA